MCCSGCAAAERAVTLAGGQGRTLFLGAPYVIVAGHPVVSSSAVMHTSNFFGLGLNSKRWDFFYAGGTCLVVRSSQGGECHAPYFYEFDWSTSSQYVLIYSWHVMCVTACTSYIARCSLGTRAAGSCKELFWYCVLCLQLGVSWRCRPTASVVFSCNAVLLMSSSVREGVLYMPLRASYVYDCLRPEPFVAVEALFCKFEPI